MSSKNTMTKEEYLYAQERLLDEAMEGNLCQIKVYPSQNRQLWLMDKAYKTVGLIHRWLLFSEYLKPGFKPEERVFSVYTFATLLQKAVRSKGAEHPRRDFIEFAEEALHKMAEKGIVELLILENGFLAACIKCTRERTADIEVGRARYKENKAKQKSKLKANVSLLKRCFELSAND